MQLINIELQLFKDHNTFTHVFFDSQYSLPHNPDVKWLCTDQMLTIIGTIAFLLRVTLATLMFLPQGSCKIHRLRYIYIPVQKFFAELTLSVTATFEAH